MYKIFTAAVFLIAIMLASGIVISQKVVVNNHEDAWFCIDGQWIKSGNPQTLPPASGCEPKKVTKCKAYNPQNCPSECVVCPPCPECSSISCQTEEFCKSQGFERGWYDGINGQVKGVDCLQNNGKWLKEFNECEYIDKEWCDQKGGEFFECQSACRHDPEANFCTEQCVPVCVLK